MSRTINEKREELSKLRKQYEMVEEEIRTLKPGGQSDCYKILLYQGRLADYIMNVKEEIRQLTSVHATQGGAGVRDDAEVDDIVEADVSEASAAGGGGEDENAQQVITLQKVNDHSAQLDLKPPPTSSTARDVDDLEAEFMGSAAVSVRSNRRDDRQKNEIRRIEKERKEQQEKLVAEKKALDIDYEALKTKFESSKARNKVLSNDLKSLMQEMQKLLTKGTHDELIQALFKQLDQLKAIVAEREAKVKALEEEIQQLRLSTFLKVHAFTGERQVSDVGTSAPNSARTLLMEDCGSLTPQPHSRSSSRHHTPYLPQKHHQPSHTPTVPAPATSSLGWIRSFRRNWRGRSRNTSPCVRPSVWRETS
jgi:hypothetical protein